MQQSNLVGPASRSANHSRNLFWVTLLSLVVLTGIVGFMIIPAANFTAAFVESVVIPGQ